MRATDHLDVARRAHQFALELYRATEQFPRSETYGLRSQLRRAAVSIGSNIAEGDSHESNRVFLRHLSIAVASSGEVDFQLLLSRDLGYVTDATYGLLAEQLSVIRGMLIRLKAHVRTRPPLKTG